MSYYVNQQLATLSIISSNDTPKQKYFEILCNTSNVSRRWTNCDAYISAHVRVITSVNTVYTIISALYGNFFSMLNKSVWSPPHKIITTGSVSKFVSILWLHENKGALQYTEQMCPICDSQLLFGTDLPFIIPFTDEKCRRISQRHQNFAVTCVTPIHPHDCRLLINYHPLNIATMSVSVHSIWLRMHQLHLSACGDIYIRLYRAERTAAKITWKMAMAEQNAKIYREKNVYIVRRLSSNCGYC